jgi:hypothetical protein
MGNRVHILGVAMAITLFSSIAATPAAHAVTVEWFFFGDGSGAFTEPPSEVLDVGSDETYQDAGQSNATGNTPVNNPGNFNPGGRSVTAYGTEFLSGEWVQDSLLENNRGTRERGLGVSGTTAEIDDLEMVVIDLGAGNLADLSNWMIQFNSVDGQEGVTLWTSSTYNPLSPDPDIIAAMLTTPLLDASDVNQGTAGSEDLNYFAINPMQYLFITASGSGSPTDVMVSALKAEFNVSVPEPASLSLLGLSLAGLGVFVRRRRRL